MRTIFMYVLLVCISCQSAEDLDQFNKGDTVICCPNPSPGCQDNVPKLLQDMHEDMLGAKRDLLVAESRLNDMIQEMQKLKVELGDRIDARIEERLIQEHLIHPDLPHEGRK